MEICYIKLSLPIAQEQQQCCLPYVCFHLPLVYQRRLSTAKNIFIKRYSSWLLHVLGWRYPVRQTLTIVWVDKGHADQQCVRLVFLNLNQSDIAIRGVLYKYLICPIQPRQCRFLYCSLWADMKFLKKISSMYVRVTNLLC